MVAVSTLKDIFADSIARPKKHAHRVIVWRRTRKARI
jgi:hypothetical protein